MKATQLLVSISCLSLLFVLPALAGRENMKDGPIIKGFGKQASVASATVDKNTQLKVAFDVATGAENGQINRKFDSLARFINMHAAAGVPLKNMQLALVVHGKATLELLNDAAFEERHQQQNPNSMLLKTLMANNVQIILCGQSAAANGISSSQVIDGVQVELSAMTAHALLQQNGFTLNPF